MAPLPSPDPSHQPYPALPTAGIEDAGSRHSEPHTPTRPHDGGLDRAVEPERPWQGTDHSGPLLIVRVQVRIVTGRSANAVRAAQGHALRALITALTGHDTEPT